MKNKLIISTILALATSCPLFSQALEFDEYVHDFGILQSGDSIASHLFGFCNASQDTLKISRIEAPCSVTVMYNAAPVEPDMADALRVNIDLSQTDGKFSKHIFIYGNFDTFSLELKGTRNLGINELYEQWQQEDETEINEDDDRPMTRAEKRKARRERRKNK